MPKNRQTDIDDFACGNLVGTLYGPEEYLTERQKRFRRMNYDEYFNYEKKVDESEGFDVDGCTGVMTGRITPLGQGGREWKVAEVVAQFAGRKQGEAMGITIEFVRLTKANIQTVAGLLYYLTFVATTTDKTEKTYRAKVWSRPITWECKILLFLDGNNGKKDLTVRTKADKMARGKRKRGTAEEEYITFSLLGYFGEPVEVPDNPTIAPDPDQLQKDGCDLFAKELKKQNPHLTDDQAAMSASSKWELLGYCDKAPFLKEARKMFERQYPQYYRDTK
ncbi:uncharacterized protein LOC141596390 isoform X1 [Silene latifolia]|uniref:uncharacterized protein LOC141596390 isoform X1 n=1 Tax=Silene latifolia TaxID=37657 RepID=UPI003D7784CC